MRMETLLLCISLGLCLITPAICLLKKEEVLKKKICFAIFTFITSFLFVDVLLMIVYQLQSNFMFQYVYSHTSIDLQGIYKVSALWAGQEGSFLLWSFIMSVAGLCVIRIKTLHKDRIISLYSILCAIILFLTVKSNPFQLTGMNVSDGMGLNKALQDGWMVVHPPLVFIGYSAMAGLLSLSVGMEKKEKDNDVIAAIIKSWIRGSILFLSMGIFSGSIWAYHALGWGGFWSWDPIENAALVPWLILCAFLHGKKRFSKIDCLLPFTLAAFGTFLTRSGILENKSVHAYAKGEDSILTFSIFGAFILLIGSICVVNILLKRRECKKKIGIRVMENPLPIFRWVTYSYAALIFIATIFPLLTNIVMPTYFYNSLSVVYVVINVLLLISQNVKVFTNRFVLICVLNTFLIVLIIITFHVMSIWLLLLWLTFLSIWVLAFSLNWKNLSFTVSHLAALLLFAGAVASSALSMKYTVMEEVTDNTIKIEDQSVSKVEIKNNETIIITSIAQDIIITNARLTSNEKMVMLSYTTKPLINLFWFGGFLLIANNLVVVFIKKCATIKGNNLLCTKGSAEMRAKNELFNRSRHAK